MILDGCGWISSSSESFSLRSLILPSVGVTLSSSASFSCNVIFDGRLLSLSAKASFSWSLKDFLVVRLTSSVKSRVSCNSWICSSVDLTLSDNLIISCSFLVTLLVGSRESLRVNDSCKDMVVLHWRTKFVTPPESRYSISNVLVFGAFIVIVWTEPSPALGISTDFMTLPLASNAVAVPIIFFLSAST